MTSPTIRTWFMVTWLLWNFTVCLYAARRAGSSATAELCYKVLFTTGAGRCILLHLSRVVFTFSFLRQLVVGHVYSTLLILHFCCWVFAVDRNVFLPLCCRVCCSDRLAAKAYVVILLSKVISTFKYNSPLITDDWFNKTLLQPKAE